MVIGLNPSTADEVIDDPTLRRCTGYASAWGFGSLYVCNLFAYRATNPRVLRTCSDPVGPENDRWIARVENLADLVLAGWGNEGNYLGRDQSVLKGLSKPVYCLAKNQNGAPKHPLYCRKDIQPVIYS